MKTRRDVMPLIAGGAAAVAWPLAARGQLNGPMRRVGALMHFAPDATGGKERLAAFHQGLRAAGWEEGRNLRIDTRWTDGRDAELRKHAAELVALDPEVILAWATPTVFALQRVSRTVPIVLLRRHRSRWLRISSKLGPARRQCDGLCLVRVRAGGEMVGTAEGGGASDEASSGAQGTLGVSRAGKVTPR